MAVHKVGVLALQGDVAEHVTALLAVGAHPVEVRVPEDMAGLDALVFPGGESTTMSRLLESSGLFDALAERLAAGMPAFGTCAGMILLATDVVDGRPDQRSFGAIDLAVRRNGYGRQLDSFETELVVDGLDDPLHGVFIRAPKIETVGPGVQVLAEHQGVPVLVADGAIMAAAFHPELTNDRRLHARFVELVTRHRTATVDDSEQEH